MHHRFTFSVPMRILYQHSRQILKLKGADHFALRLHFSRTASDLFGNKSAKMPEVRSETSSPVAKEARLESKLLSPSLRFAKLTENAFTPTRGSKQAAGFDLYSAYDYIVAAKGKVLAKTDIQIALPEGCYGRVAPRSGLAHKHFIDVGAGVIDQDYRGNVGVILFNFGEEEFKVSKGDRIAQLILERIYIPDLEELSSLDDTERGSGGFGSTGKQ